MSITLKNIKNDIFIRIEIKAMNDHHKSRIEPSFYSKHYFIDSFIDCFIDSFIADFAPNDLHYEITLP